MVFVVRLHYMCLHFWLGALCSPDDYVCRGGNSLFYIDDMWKETKSHIYKVYESDPFSGWGITLSSTVRYALMSWASIHNQTISFTSFSHPGWYSALLSNPFFCVKLYKGFYLSLASVCPNIEIQYRKNISTD